MCPMSDNGALPKHEQKIPQPHGGALNGGGTPGNKGGTGQQPLRFITKMQQAADRGAQALIASRILDDPDHPMFIDALKWCADRGYGKAVARHELSGPDGEPIELRAAQAREQLQDRLRRLAAETRRNGG